MTRTTAGARVPLAVAFGLAAGSGVLVVLWFTRGTLWPAPPPGLPGLFDFPSAYVGDVVLLPIAAAMLAAGVRRLPRARRERSVVIASGAVAALAAVTVQWLWFADDRPRGNWTLPEPHRFNLAGVWHAAYFIVTATLLTVLAVALAMRLSAAVRGGEHRTAESLLRGSGAAVVLSCLLSYAVLAVGDSLSGTSASRASLVALGLAAAILIGLAVLTLGRRAGLLVPHMLLATIAATAAVLAVDAPWSAERTQVLGATAAALAGIGVAVLSLVPARGLDGDTYATYRPDPGHVPVVATILAVLSAALWTWAAAAVVASRWSDVALWVAAYLAAIAACPALIVRARRLRWLGQAADVMVVFAALGLICLVALTVPRWREVSDSAPFSSFLVALFLSLVLFPILKIRMHAEIRDEQSGPDGSGSFGLVGAARLSATATIAMLIIAGVSGAVSLIGFTLAAAVDRSYVADRGGARGAVVLLLGGVGVVLAAWALARARSASGRSWMRAVAPMPALLWLAGIVLVGLHRVDPVTPVAVGGGVLLALWSANTTLNNVGLLRGERPDAVHWSTIGAVAGSAFATGFIAMQGALAASPSHVYTWFAGISTGAAILAIHGGLTVVTGLLVVRSDARHTRHGLAHNLIQDASIITLLYLIALVIPAATLLHLPPDLGFWARLLATFMIVGPFLAYFLTPYQWLLDTNLGHLEREVSSRAEDPERTRAVLSRERRPLRRNRVLLTAAVAGLHGPAQHRFLRVLNGHIRNQNTIGAAVVALSLVGFLVLLGGKTSAALAYLRRGERVEPEPSPTQPATPART